MKVRSSSNSHPLTTLSHGNNNDSPDRIGVMAFSNQQRIAGFILLAIYSANGGYGSQGSAVNLLARFNQDAEIFCKEESVKSRQCNSSWVYSINGESFCGTIPYNLLRCNSNKNVVVLVCNCATYNETDKTLDAGSCIYNCGNKKSRNVRCCSSSKEPWGANWQPVWKL